MLSIMDIVKKNNNKNNYVNKAKLAFLVIFLFSNPNSLINNHSYLSNITQKPSKRTDHDPPASIAAKARLQRCCDKARHS